VSHHGQHAPPHECRDGFRQHPSRPCGSDMPFSIKKMPPEL
jgi:hypothetical protein